VGVLLFKWLITAWASLHPFYVSVTEIAHNKSKNELQVSCRIFADDLENALKKQYKAPLDIIHPANRATTDSLIAIYLAGHLSITTDGKPVRLQYLGYKIEEEAAWCFLAAEQVPAFKRAHVRNNILYDEHPNQINMIHVILNEVRKSTKLDNPKADADFAF
jgi:predicted lipase